MYIHVIFSSDMSFIKKLLLMQHSIFSEEKSSKGFNTKTTENLLNVGFYIF